ncbi:Cytochrome c-type biogenesis protein CcmE [Halanaeroarchaeum sp. HSR-CO]|uniref:cytochrome c maturation protein CcmE domain-containing protein n=1 Tax=Halanaeroarchaeum sp. HSR-CO TaxID=2866382 RepID=UPI00217D469F|nr:cytochrome c maturation protein CcmE [Halanaeroarchaeum sp. HSR-CO]UWG49083.1 Cytochrome c-type biogenesis protein CcmE [Halanaeroarchaeum sp. HSR-CO]
MKRTHRILLGAIVIAVLVGVVSTSMGTTTAKVSPGDLQSGEYDGEYVILEGLATDVRIGNTVTLTVVGNSSETRTVDDNATEASVPAVVTDDSIPATLESGRIVVLEGTYDDGRFEASSVMVKSHEQ